MDKSPECNLPNEVFAVTAESWMFKKPWNEFMIFDFRYILLFQSSFSSPQSVE